MSNYHISGYKTGSFIGLCIFALAFPVLEGLSNSVYPIGTVGLGGAAALIWTFQSTITHRVVVVLEARILLIFVLWMTITAIWSSRPGESLSYLISLILCLVLYVMVTDLSTTRERILVLISFYLVGVIIIGLSSVKNINLGLTYEGLSNRYSASGFDPNNFGFIMVSALPLVFAVTSGRHMIIRLAAGAVAMCLLYLTFASGSRAAVMMIPLVLTGVVWYFLRSRRKLVAVVEILAAGTLMLLVFVDFIPVSALDRLKAGILHDQGGARFLIWRDAARLISDSLIIGHGYGTSLSLLGEQAHSTFMSAALEGGVIGLGLWATFWAAHLARAVRVGRRRGNDVLGIALMFALLAVLGAAVTLNWEHRKSLYFLMALTAAYVRAGALQTAPSKLRRRESRGGVEGYDARFGRLCGMSK